MISQEIAAEIDNFEAEMNRFLRGELSPERFRAFRLGHGIYGQRQPNVQMVRVKIPTGSIRGAQLATVADLVERFSSGRAHLTTRQDIQFHFVKLSHVPTIMRALAEVGLTTREACGNSVRNVTACPLTGFIADELFDVTPYALAVSAFLIRNPWCQQMARKFKVALSACPEDCVATAIHDIGLLARRKDENGRASRGFKVIVGGGLGATPFTAQPLVDFLPADELLSTIKAIVKVAANRANRRTRARARLKFLVHKMGIDAFKKLVADARADMTAEERREADLRLYLPEDRVSSVSDRPASGRADSSPCEPQDDGADEADPAFLRWRARSVRSHKDAGRAVVTVQVPLGDLEAPALRILARLVTSYGHDQVRIAIDQNIVLPDVDRADLKVVYEELGRCGLTEASAGTALDVTSCPGAETCNLGITSSKGLARAIRSRIRSRLGANGNGGGLDALRDVKIKISGCPNSCGHHHIADIGFHGVVKRTGDTQIPAYQLHLGGRAVEGRARLARARHKIPARRVPEVVTAVLSLFEKERAGDEPLSAFLDRVGVDAIDELVEPLAAGTPPDDGEDLRTDWGQTGVFSTAGMGQGECAGAAETVSDEPFEPFEAEILQARLFIERGQWVDALANLNRSQYTLARVLLKPLGKRPESDYECTCELRAKVIDRGHAGELWNVFHTEIERLLGTRSPDPRSLRRLHRLSRELLKESKRTLRVLGRLKEMAAPHGSPA